MSYSVCLKSSTKSFSCTINKYTYKSPTLGGTTATFGLILPAQRPCPTLYWLSGLTCTPDNFLTKANGALHAAQHKVAVVVPDTSPRGAGVPGEEADWDFGTGAGFYVDAVTEGWRECYRMASFVVDELPKVVSEAVGHGVLVDGVRSVSGHSMGGMGALSLALRNRGAFVSVSAFAPIANPVDCAWGIKCFGGYLGDERRLWEEYDPTCLMRKGKLGGRILVDQGMEDGFLGEQLKVGQFVEACEKVGQEVEVNWAEGYDHSYYFVATFLGKHVKFHADEMWKRVGENGSARG